MSYGGISGLVCVLGVYDVIVCGLVYSGVIIRVLDICESVSGCECSTLVFLGSCVSILWRYEWRFMVYSAVVSLVCGDLCDCVGCMERGR